MWLGILFNYIKRNYDDEEIIISLFSDHGQGYMVPDGSDFLSKERSKIALMFRCGTAYGIGRTDELISAVDYGCIMRKISGIHERNVDIDGQLPRVFGGSEERKYTISESLHPGDPYRMAVHTGDITAYFINDVPVGDDGRFALGNYRCYLEDKEGSIIENKEMLQYYTDIVLKHIAPILIYK